MDELGLIFCGFCFCTNGHSKKFVSILYEFHFGSPIFSCFETDLLFLPPCHLPYGLPFSK